MARFFGTMQGRRGRAHTATDPDFVQLSGWDAGVRVQVAEAGTRQTGPADAFEVYMTYGSHAAGNPVKIGTVYQTSDGPVFVAVGDDMTLGDAYTEEPR